MDPERIGLCHFRKIGHVRAAAVFSNLCRQAKMKMCQSVSWRTVQEFIKCLKLMQILKKFAASPCS